MESAIKLVFKRSPQSIGEAANIFWRNISYMAEFVP